MIYVTSDLHFDHKNIIKLCNRPFDSVEEMNNAIIENWNKTVKQDDEVYILGDIALSNNVEAVKNFMNQLNGKKHLIAGNHDSHWLKRYKNGFYDFFESISDYKELKIEDSLFCMMHYPIDDWNKKHYGSFMLHGHSHNASQYNENHIRLLVKQYDVGVDANNFTPVSLFNIFKKYHDSLIKNQTKRQGYELMFIVKPFEENETKAIVEDAEKYVDQVGFLNKSDKWGIKHLSYTLKGYNKGFYVLFTFECDEEGIKSIQEKMINNPDILQYMIIRKDY